MPRRRAWRARSLPLLLLAAVSAVACGPEEDDAPPPAPAASGAPPVRIVSLVPSATETLIALGGGDRLVGRTDYDTATALAALPSVGGGLHPSGEVLLSLRPDLVVRFASSSDVETPAFLDRRGIPQVVVEPEGVEDVREMIRRLGEVVGRPAAADSMVEAIDRDLQDVRRRVAGRPAVRTAFLLGGTPPYVAGAGSFPHELLTLAGGVNVFADLGSRYAPVSPEELLARDIDVVLTAPGTEVGTPLGGVPVRRVGAAVELPGPRVAEAARSVARALHPEAFVDPLPDPSGEPRR